MSLDPLPQPQTQLLPSSFSPSLFSNQNDCGDLRTILKTHNLPLYGKKNRLLARLTLYAYFVSQDFEGKGNRNPREIIERLETAGAVKECSALWGARQFRLDMEADKWGVDVEETTKDELVREIMARRIMTYDAYRNAVTGKTERETNLAGTLPTTRNQFPSVPSGNPYPTRGGLSSSIHRPRSDADGKYPNGPRWHGHRQPKPYHFRKQAIHQDSSPGRLPSNGISSSFGENVEIVTLYMKDMLREIDSILIDGQQTINNILNTTYIGSSSKSLIHFFAGRLF